MDVYALLSPLYEKATTASFEELLGFSTEQLKETQNGGLAVQSKITHRLAAKTEISHYLTPEHYALIAKAISQSLTNDLVRIDRTIGKNNVACTLLLPKKYGWIGAYWAATLFDPIQKQADLVTIVLPHWPEQKILVLAEEGITLVLGSDYVGETKMSFLRLAMYWTRKTMGLGLHAGSKTIYINEGQKGALFFGLSGTGKTTLCTHSLFLEPPEKSIVHQDDVVLWQMEGNAVGTEQNFYVKTEGISEKNQPEIYRACLTNHALLENVSLKEGQPDFSDTSRTSNGRAIVFRKDLQYSNGVDLEKVDLIFFITRRSDILPVAAKLSPQQAAAFFMLGESVETSAGDPAQAGKTRRVVGFNPFIVGDPAEEGNRFLEMVEKHGVQCFLLNTSSIGEKIKISADLSAKLVEQIARGKVRWKMDADWGYQVLTSVGGLDISSLDPQAYHDAATYAEKTIALKTERKAWLEKFNGLDPRILSSLG